MKYLLFICVLFFSTQTLSQTYQDPKEAAAKAQQDAWAAAQKAKAKNDAIVAKQRAQEQQQDTYKGLKKSGVKVNIYGGQKGGSISK